MVDSSLDASISLLSCRVCQKSFGRHEHLKRHELTHEDPKFQCSSCSKCFARKDGLERHEAIHRSTPSLVRKKARACLTCAAAKARCSGDRPSCQRCARKEWMCAYPTAEEQRDEQQQSPSDQHTSDDTGNADYDGENHVIGPEPSSSNAAGSLSYQNALATLDMQPPLSVTNWTHDMDGYLHNWDNAELNINWLPLNYVDFDINDLNVQFPFQQTNEFGATMANSSSNLANNPAHLRWDAPVLQAAQRETSSPLAEQPPPHALSASPASILNATSNSPIPISPAQTTTSGEFYVDGNGARLPRVKRRRLTSVTTPRSTTSTGLGLCYPPSLMTRDPQADQVGLQQFSQLQYTYSRLCLMSNFFRPFSETEFSSREALSNLIDIFIEHVHPWFPILHLPTLDMSRLDAVQVLAMAALGARQIQAEEGEALSTALLEFLRRVFLDLAETHDFPHPPAGSLCQSQFWYATGALFSGVKSLRESGDEILRQISSTYFSDANRRGATQMTSNIVSGDEEWRTWARAEELSRLRFSIWLLDGIISAENRATPILGLTSVSHLVLPSHEAIWSADSASVVQQLSIRFASPPDVSTVIQNLYVSKELPPDLGEFTQLLITHGIIKLTREMRPHLRHDLSGFIPSAEKRPAISPDAQNDNRRRAQEIYQRWRNAACDSIDVLHWRANAMIGGASGMEHPGVMHLHFTRVVLLAPLQEIVALAEQLAYPNGSGVCAEGITLQARQQPIRHWILEDPYKARLAAIHAGVLFWHVRRYSSSAFYEPGAVALSTLMLWALSAFSSRTIRTAADQGTEPTNANMAPNAPHSSRPVPDPPIDTCDIILIDRPTDDVLVQQFVRQGQNMQAIMTGVGDLFGPLGAQRVLREGHKLISSLDSWRYHAKYWLDLLRALDVATSSVVNGNNNAMATTGTAESRR